ncbi:hypothetical protein J4444_03615 [Candidatus Woesearchaeota archaeon]|nr:hypothetical protein [Candidatus Woesearchaeota archaeon]
MTIVTKTLDQMLDEIKACECSYFDFWLPIERLDRHRIRYELGGYLDILSSYVDQILKNISPETGVSPDNLLATVLVQAFENSLTRGNLRNLYLPISLKIFEGPEGVVFRIRDSGAGFDYNAILEQRRRGDGSYIQGSGMGLEVMNYKQYEVAFEGNGNTVNIMATRGYSFERSWQVLMDDRKERGLETMNLPKDISLQKP